MTAQILLSPHAATVLGKSTLNAGKILGLNQQEVGLIIGKNRSSITRGIDPQSKSGELALLLIRCYRALSVLVGGGDTQIQHWFNTENHHVGGVPKELCYSVQGLVAVTQYLDAIRGKV